MDTEILNPARGRPSRSTVALAATYAIAVPSAVFSNQLGLGSLRHPGPGLWPMLISCGLLAAATVGLLTSSHRLGRTRTDASEERAAEPRASTGEVSRDAGDMEQAKPRGWPDLVVAVLSLLAFIVAFEKLGMLLPTLALLVLWLRFLGRESWPHTIAIAIGITVSIWVVFVRLLALPLPPDTLGI